jgi:hypothetical protein
MLGAVLVVGAKKGESERCKVMLDGTHDQSG